MSEREPGTPAPKPLQALPLDDIEGLGDLDGLACDPDDPDCAAPAVAPTPSLEVEQPEVRDGATHAEGR